MRGEQRPSFALSQCEILKCFNGRSGLSIDDDSSGASDELSKGLELESAVAGILCFSSGNVITTTGKHIDKLSKSNGEVISPSFIAAAVIPGVTSRATVSIARTTSHDDISTTRDSTV